MKTTRYPLGDYELLAVPVLRDNFVYVISRAGQAVLIDAGEAGPVFQTLDTENLQLTDLLITHTHHDHVGGCRAIQDRLGVQATSPGVESGAFECLGTQCRSISTPGHMAVHKVYYFPELKVLFSGDTIINGACGRLLGGTYEQFFESLQMIKSYPDETRIFGGHDYLQENMEFALAVEPDNEDMKKRLVLYRQNPASAIFVTLAEEKKTNPFLRATTLDEFIRLRELKDVF
jgi:hydroxyacylglutathione hydrolase